MYLEVDPAEAEHRIIVRDLTQPPKLEAQKSKFDDVKCTAERVGIYVACNTAAHLAFNGAMGAAPALAALTALKTTAPASVAYGLAMSAGAGVCGLPAAPSILMSTALAPAAVATCVSLASPASAVARTAIFAHAAAKNIPVGAMWAAEWAAYAAVRDRWDAAAGTPGSEHNKAARFAVGAASITAVCAAIAPFRAVPWIGAQVASKMIKSKVCWYGSYEAMKATTAPRMKTSSDVKSEADAARSERERRKNVGDAQRRAHAVARATARRPTKLREIPRIKRRAGATPGTPVVHLIPARGFAF